MTPEQRSLRARLAAHTMHSQGKTNTEAARRAFDQRFLDLVDPERKLPEHERARRAEHARRAHFAALSLKAAKKRQAVASQESAA